MASYLTGHRRRDDDDEDDAGPEADEPIFASRASADSGPVAGSPSPSSSRVSSTNEEVSPPVTYNERVLATGNGIVVSIGLAESVLFLEGFDRSDAASRKTTLLRGSLHIRTTKPVKIKRIDLSFRGIAQTLWPEGIPPRKTSTVDNVGIIHHTWTFFNALFPDAEHSYCADSVLLSPTAHKSPAVTTREIVQPHKARARDVRRMSLQPGHISSEPSSVGTGPTVAQRGYKVFQPGDYLYNFEMPIDSRLPETIHTDLGSVHYTLDAVVERAGAFRPNLRGSQETPFIRTPAEESLEHVEPIAISRTWEDQLHYDIIISGKSFPMGAQVPIAFKLTPLAKVFCHRVKVYLTENAQYWAANRSVHKLDASRKVLLMEKRAGQRSVNAYPGGSVRTSAGGGFTHDDRRRAAVTGEELVNPRSTNLLGDLDSGSELGAGPTELEFTMQLPTCAGMRTKDPSQRLHFDTTYDNIEINHWIKVRPLLILPCLEFYPLTYSDRPPSLSPRFPRPYQASSL